MTGLPPPEASSPLGGTQPSTQGSARPDVPPTSSTPSDGGSTPPNRLAATIIAVMIFGLVAAVALIPIILDNDDDLANSVTDTVPSGESLPPEDDVDAAAPPAEPIPPAETLPPETLPPETLPPETAPAPVGSDAPVANDSAQGGESTGPSPAYPTLPDGSPVPIVAIFDVETITLTGFVPTVESAEWLRALAIANSNFPDAEIVDQLVIDPTVPVNIGVRVIELNSPRFPEGSAEVLSEHAAQLDRVASVMTSLPNVTVIVVGHADQRGDSAGNYVLSEERARSVVRYLVSQDIEPSRLASRAVGEEDLLTLDQSEAALELNRRTEFVFYGLLAV